MKSQMIGCLFLVGNLFVFAVLAIFVVGIVIRSVRGGLSKGPRLVKNTTPLGRFSSQTLIVHHILFPKRGNQIKPNTRVRNNIMNEYSFMRIVSAYHCNKKLRTIGPPFDPEGSDARLHCSMFALRVLL